jgi:hypothetical protein
LQFLRNHFSTLAESENRSGLTEGAKGAMVLPVLACLPDNTGEAPWQDAQLKSLAALALKNF